MQIRTIQKGFKAFECKFEPFERDSNHSKAIRSILIQILTIRKGIRSIQKQIRTIR